MLKINTITYFRFIILLLMITTYLPIVYTRLPAYIGSHHFWTIVWGISLLFLKLRVLFHRIMLLIFAYALFLWVLLNTVWHAMIMPSVTHLWDEIYAVAVGVSIFVYFNESKDYIGWAKMIRYTLIFIVITAVLTIIASIINPMYMRLHFVQSHEADMARAIAYKYGAGTYGTAMVFMALLPLLIYYFKQPSLFFITKKWVILLLILIVGIAVLRMQLFANIMIALFVSIIAMSSVKNRLRTIVVISIIGGIMVLIPTKNHVNTLNKLADNISEYEETSFKIKEFAYYLERGGEVKTSENAVAGRAERYPMLLEAFSKSPIMGCFFQSDSYGNGYNEKGFHVYWMNKLTVTGIVGFVFFLSIIIVFVYRERKNIEGGYSYYYLLAIFSVLLYGVFKNIGGREIWYFFFVIILGMYYLPLLKKKNNMIEDNVLNQ